MRQRVVEREAAENYIHENLGQKYMDSSIDILLGGETWPWALSQMNCYNYVRYTHPKNDSR